MSLPEVRDEVLRRYSPAQAGKFVIELAWREYWQREWTFRGDAIFSDVKDPQHPVSSTRLPRAVLEAHTGVDALDAAIRTLYDDGYAHNHERMWLAALVCNTARTHWWRPSQWMYYHLMDGDPASNSLSWQWVSGTYGHQRYLAAQQNLNEYSAYRQHGSIIDRDYHVLADMPVPDELRDRAALRPALARHGRLDAATVPRGAGPVVRLLHQFLEAPVSGGNVKERRGKGLRGVRTAVHQPQEVAAGRTVGPGDLLLRTLPARSEVTRAPQTRR